MAKNIFYLPGLVSLIGVILICTGLRDFWFADQSKKWLMTKGSITDVYFSKITSKSLHGSINLHYQYIVGDNIYLGDRVSFSQSYYNDAADSQKSYVKGETVDVYYDPGSPRNSVLLPGYKQNLKDFSTIISGGFILIVASLLHNVIKNKNS